MPCDSQRPNRQVETAPAPPMQANLLRIITVFLMTAATAWAISLSQIAPIVALVGAVAIILLYLPLMMLQFALSIAANWRTAPKGTFGWQYLQSFWGELWLSLDLFMWRQPFRPNQFADNLSANTVSNRRGVVFVHGFMCNRATWAPWMRQLQQQGRAFVAVNLEPPWGRIENYADTIDDVLLREPVLRSGIRSLCRMGQNPEFGIPSNLRRLSKQKPDIVGNRFCIEDGQPYFFLPQWTRSQKFDGIPDL